MIPTAGALGPETEGALIDADVALIAKVAFDDVVELHTIGRPGGGCNALFGRARCVIECPGECRPHVCPVVGLACRFGVNPEDTLVDTDVFMVAKMELNNVVEPDAACRPLGQGWSGCRLRRNDQYCDNHDRPHTAHDLSALAGRLPALGWRAV
ncbi:MAG: hypothetical protein OXG65_16980 [Chloroflexi bacterium]|nr:hypothetical protein [Chloroflexota bacterium]